MSLPQTTAGKVEWAIQLAKVLENLPWYQRLAFRIKYGKNWRVELVLSALK